MQYKVPFNTNTVFIVIAPLLHLIIGLMTPRFVTAKN